MTGGAPAQFTGTVSDLGAPVAGAAVEAVSGGLVQASAITGTDGVYFLYVQAGTYTLQASGIYSVTTPVGAPSVAAGDVSTVNLNLPALGRIRGNIKLSNGLPATTAAVRVVGESLITNAQLDASGNFTTIGLPPSGYTVSGNLAGLTPVKRRSVGFG